MKLSAIFVSVNIMAALPVAASAAEEAVSDKAEWLKQNLAALDQTKKSERCKFSLSDPNAGSRARTGRLRPFVPNRKLLSKRDMEMALIAQQARLDERNLATSMMAQQPAPLAGQVSAFGNQNDQSAYNQIPSGLSCQYEKVTRKGRPAQRAIPGQVPSLPGQVAYLQSQAAAIPRIPEPPMERMVEQPTRARANNMFGQQLKPGEHMVRQTGALIVQTPSLTADEQQMYDELMQMKQQNGIQHFAGNVEQRAQPTQMFQPAIIAAPPRQDPGPPPFPLNMLPEGALKELVGHRRPHTNAPPAYFGSWHRPVSLSNLPECGFHSNISHKVSGKYFPHYAPGARRAYHMPQQPTKRRKIDYPSVAYSQPEVLLYPPYSR